MASNSCVPYSLTCLGAGERARGRGGGRERQLIFASWYITKIQFHGNLVCWRGEEYHCKQQTPSISSDGKNDTANIFFKETVVWNSTKLLVFYCKSVRKYLAPQFCRPHTSLTSGMGLLDFGRGLPGFWAWTFRAFGVDLTDFARDQHCLWALTSHLCMEHLIYLSGVYPEIDH